MSFPIPLSDSLLPIACLIIPPSCLFTATCLYFWHPLECLSLQPPACLFCTPLPVFIHPFCLHFLLPYLSFYFSLPVFLHYLACLCMPPCLYIFQSHRLPIQPPLLPIFSCPLACLFSPRIARHVLSLCLSFSIRCLSFYAPLLVFTPLPVFVHKILLPIFFLHYLHLISNDECLHTVNCETLEEHRNHSVLVLQYISLTIIEAF